MGAATMISVREYLSTSHDPDREYLDGELRERNVGERDHSETENPRIELPLAEIFAEL